MAIRFVPIVCILGLYWVNQGLGGDSTVCRKIDRSRTQKEVQLFEDGSILKEVTFYLDPDGSKVRHGSVRYWYPNGLKRAELPFLHGKKNGRELEWNEAGRIIVDRTWKNGVQWTGKFKVAGEGLVEEYKNGQLMTTTDLAGNPVNGPHISLHGHPYRVYEQGRVVYEEQFWQIPGGPDVKERLKRDAPKNKDAVRRMREQTKGGKKGREKKAGGEKEEKGSGLSIACENVCRIPTGFGWVVLSETCWAGRRPTGLHRVG